MPTTRATLLSFLVICGLSSPATLLKADIAFSNLGTTSGYFELGSVLNSGPGGSGITLGQPFMVTGASADYLLTDVQVPVSALSLLFGSPSPFNVSIYSDTSVGLPGSFIAGGGGVAPYTPDSPTIVTVPVSGTDPVLESGNVYWIVMSGVALDWWNTGVIQDTPYDLPTPYQVWNNLGNGWNFGYYQFESGAGFQLESGVEEFQVDGTPYTPVVPEPGNLVFLVAIAFVAMALLRLRRHTGNV